MSPDGGEDAAAGDATLDGAPETGAASDDAGPLDGSGPADAGIDVAAPAEAGLDANAPVDAAIDAADAGFIDASDAGPVVPLQGRIRFANVAPDLAAAVDFCVAASGQAFGVPYLESQGVAAGLSYKQVSEYAPSPTGSVRVRVVGAGSSNCATPLAGIADLSFVADDPATVPLMGTAGDGGNPLALRVYSDDLAPATAQAATNKVRVIHAAPFAPAADFEVGAGAYVIPEQVAVPYGDAFGATTQAPNAATPDGNGYITLGMTYALITAKVAGTEVTSLYAHSSYPRVTAFLVGIDGSASTPLAFVGCDDSAAPQGHLSTCNVRTSAPAFATLRFVQLAPDAQARDICLGPDGHVFGGNLTGPLSGPLLAAPAWRAAWLRSR